MVKNPPAMRKTRVWALGREDCLEEGVAAHSSILAWRISMDRGATVHVGYSPAVAESDMTERLGPARGIVARWVFAAACRLSLAAAGGALFTAVASLVVSAGSGCTGFGRHGAWASLPSSRWHLPGPGDQTGVPCIGRRILHCWTTSKVLEMNSYVPLTSF